MRFAREKDIYLKWPKSECQIDPVARNEFQNLDKRKAQILFAFYMTHIITQGSTDLVFLHRMGHSETEDVSPGMTWGKQQMLSTLGYRLLCFSGQIM